MSKFDRWTASLPDAEPLPRCFKRPRAEDRDPSIVTPLEALAGLGVILVVGFVFFWGIG